MNNATTLEVLNRELSDALASFIKHRERIEKSMRLLSLQRQEAANHYARLATRKKKCCRRGHAFTFENTTWGKNSNRVTVPICRICKNNSQRKRRGVKSVQEAVEAIQPQSEREIVDLTNARTAAEAIAKFRSDPENERLFLEAQRKD